MANEYACRNKSVPERKTYGLKFRREIEAALPATVPELVERFGRSRASILHHIHKMPDVVIDTRYYPRVIRKRRINEHST